MPLNFPPGTVSRRVIFKNAEGELITTAIAFHHRPLDSQTASFGPLTAVHMANGFDYDLRGMSGDGGEIHDTAYLAALHLTDQTAVWREACAAIEETAP